MTTGCPIGKLYVPDNFRSAVIQWVHTSRGTGHPRGSATQHLVSRRYWWPGWRSEVEQYVASCPECAQLKSSHQSPAGLLHPLPIPSRPWSHLGMDFITDLPLSRGNTVVLTVVDRFSKMCRLIALPKLPSATELADVLIQWIFRYYGIPEDLVSDRGPQFTSHVYKAFCAKLNVSLSPTSAYHPQSNGLAERTNQEVSKALHLLCKDKLSDWASHLVWAEYGINTRINPVTRMSPFQCVLGFQPGLFPWDAETSDVPQVETWYRTAREVWQKSHSALSAQAARQQTQANRHRRPAPAYRPGQWVWLLTRNLKLPACRKLSARFIGPFKIIHQVGPDTFRLDLPRVYRIHPTFHVSLLKPVRYSAAHPSPDSAASYLARRVPRLPGSSAPGLPATGRDSTVPRGLGQLWP
uniref:Gypsy retrotransposon integrase-like protein 1 n=1 Tax=Paramormyrops kingsleyae TaxID=1676925 RepID=A0A3B3Q687_9TELE